MNPQNELIKSRELADILRNFPNQSKIITTPYVNFPFKQLNKTYMDVRTIYDFDKIKDHPFLTVIGHACDKKIGCQMITGLGQQIELTAQGWQSFSKI